MYLNSFLEALVYVVYSFLSPIITAGGGLLVTNVLTTFDINLIKAAGMTSSFFLLNGLIVSCVFRKDIVWSEVVRFLPLSLVGAILGALFLVNMNTTLLLFLMFCFSIYFIYGKLVSKKVDNFKESKIKEQTIALLSGMLVGTALPGGGFRNSYFLSKGMSLQNMHGTTSIIGVLLWTAKISVLVSSSVLVFKDFIGVLIAFPFLIVSNILLRRGLIKMPKNISDKITIFAMTVFCVYAGVVILRAIF